MSVKPLLSILFLTLASATAETQEPTVKDYDLAKAKPSDTVNIKPGRYRFRIINQVPTAEYTVTISTGTERIPPIDLDEAKGGACEATDAATKALQAAKKEGDVADLVSGVVKALESDRKKLEEERTSDNKAKYSKAGVDSLMLACDVSAEEAIGATRYEIDETFDLENGDFVTIAVSRMKDNNSEQEWRRRYTTGARGEWRTTYGYAFPFLTRIHSMSQLKGEGAQLVPDQVGTTAQYVLRPQRRTKQFDALPMLIFTYAPPQDAWYFLSWSAGIAADITKPQLIFGPSLTYRSNLLLSAGVAFREEKLPLARYSAGDTVGENLTTDQLQEEQFRARPYVSVSLRLSRNPFKKDESSDSKKEEKKPEEKKDDKKDDKKDKPSRNKDKPEAPKPDKPDLSPDVDGGGR